MTEDITQLRIPRLAVGSHKGNSGVGCIMNLMCWVQGARHINDNPAGWNPELRDLMITANDYMCYETTRGYDNFGVLVTLNCPKCSEFLLDAAFTLAHSAWLDEGIIGEGNFTVLDHYVQEANQRLQRFPAIFGRSVRVVHHPKPALSGKDARRYYEELAKAKHVIGEVIRCYNKLLDQYNPPQQSLPPFVHTVEDAVTTGQFMTTAPALVTVPEGSSTV